jgi:hypothetical protein
VIWPDQLHKAGADYKVMKSPFDRRRALDTSSAPVSYGLNNKVFGLSTSDFVSPSSLIIMSDAATTGHGGAPVFSGVATDNVSVAPGTNSGVYRGGTFLNVLYADYHVAPLIYRDYMDVGSLAGKKRWDPTFDETATTGN